MKSLKTKILSLNIGQPQKMVWQNQETQSSMLKSPVAGPLEVSMTSIKGDSFQSPQIHGTPFSVIYVLGMNTAKAYMKSLGQDSYQPGALGENLTLEHFDEADIGIGDIFQVGEVVAQCTFPRIPCFKVNIRMQHPDGQANMKSLGRSGAYFSIIKPGRIFITDTFERISQPSDFIPLQEVYRKKAQGEPMSKSDYERFLANPFLPTSYKESLKTKLSSQ